MRNPCRLEWLRGGFLRFSPNAGIGFLHHLLAEVDAHQVVLEDVVIEHVLGGLAQVHDPLADGGRPHSERHVLRVVGAGGVIVAANAADAAGDEVGIARIFALHEDAVAAEDGRGAVTLRHLAVLEVDLSEDAETPDNAGNRIPVHLDQVSFRSGSLGRLIGYGSHVIFLNKISDDTRWSVPFHDAATWVPC